MRLAVWLILSSLTVVVSWAVPAVCVAQDQKEIPVEFMPGVIPGAEGVLHGFPALSADGRMICWPVVCRGTGRPRGVIRWTERAGPGWTSPADLLLTGVILPQAPVFGPGGRLYFQARHPGGPGGLDICSCPPRGNGWGPAEALPAPLNSAGNEGNPSFTAAGDMYLSVSMAETGWKRGIAVARRTAAGWSRPVPLPPPVNSPAIDAYPFISPGEEFLLFCSSRKGEGEQDLRMLVTFRGEKGAWQEPLDLGAALGLAPPLRFPALSPDARYLFFQVRNRVFRVPAAVVERLRRKYIP